MARETLRPRIGAMRSGKETPRTVKARRHWEIGPWRKRNSLPADTPLRDVFRFMPHGQSIVSRGQGIRRRWPSVGLCGNDTLGGLHSIGPRLQVNMPHNNRFMRPACRPMRMRSKKCPRAYITVCSCHENARWFRRLWLHANCLLPHMCYVT